MQYKALVLILFLPVSLCFGQHGEFTIYPNGLMYSDTTMRQLKYIVDSLNLKFKTCELNKDYYTKYQAKGHYIYLAKGNNQEAQKDIRNNIPLNEFIKKYPRCKVDRDLLVIKSRFKNYEEKEMISFSSIPFGTAPEHSLILDEKPGVFDRKFLNTWLVDEDKELDPATEEPIRAFFFTTEFERQTLTEYYARMIQYADCLVDTNKQIFTEKAERDVYWNEEKQLPHISKFMNFIHTGTQMPVYKENDDTYWDSYSTWLSVKDSIIENSLSKQAEFYPLLRDAIAEALEHGNSEEELEEYTAKYYSKKTALELKRNRIVVGGCSMDDSPRIHALNIAKLSAESVNWETFLRAHLDIMNDHFERVSDGSWAWEGRKTYIKELEELDINVLDLLLGISLRLDNPSQNHYYGDIGRLGRALSETKHSQDFEIKVLQMIKDDKLDDYNRIVMYYLFRNYNSFIEEKKKQKENTKKIKKAVKTLPTYLARRYKK